MPRFIPVPLGAGAVQELTVAIGDVLSFTASGGQVLSGSSVEFIGVFGPGTVGTDGRVLSPAGPPNRVLVRAAAPGRSTLRLATGDPFRGASPSEVDVVVSPVDRRNAPRRP